MKRITAVVVALVALFIVGAPAANAATCTTQTYSYDTGGAPGAAP